MCGIAGIVKFIDGITPDDIKLGHNMLSVMPWRGPDHKATWSDQNAILAHLRLSVIDLSDRAHQPMVDSLGRVIIFNGEIYNYIELRAELAPRYAFKTQSDTEVILAAYHVWGLDCVRHFNGDWAFAILDPRSRRLFLSRDRFGIKPLYYYHDQSRLIFGSEVRTVLAGGAPREVRKARLAEFIKYKQIETPHSTLIEGITPVRPGTSLVATYNGTISKIAHYDQHNLFSADVPPDFEEAKETFGRLFTDAVCLRMRSDVPVGVCLSGGLDSSAIVAIASSNGQKPINTYSAIFPGSEADESRYSYEVAARFHTRHHVIQPSLDDFFETFDDFILAQDSPHHSPKTLARYLVLKRAAQDVTVVLDGQGGDEIFGGYARCYKIYQREYEKPFGKRLLMKVPLKDDLPGSIPELQELSPALKFNSVKVSRTVDKLQPPRDSYTNQQYIRLRNNLLGLLHTEDRLTMIHSMEGRVPLLDHRLVEFCFTAPVAFKMQEYDKFILREWLQASNLLPTIILLRTDKQGFSTSYGQLLRTHPRAINWFKERLGSLLRDISFIFNKQTIFALLEEQQQRGVNNVNRLLTVISTLSYFKSNQLSLID